MPHGTMSCKGGGEDSQLHLLVERKLTTSIYTYSYEKT